MNFPQSLGKFLADGYSYKIDPGIAKTKLQNGLVRYRKRSNQRTVIDVGLRIKLSQMAVLETFIRNDAYDWFDAVVAIDGEIETKTVRLYSFGGVSKENGVWQISMTLELYEHTNEYDLMTAEEREVFYNYEPEEIHEASLVDPDAPLYGFA